MSVKYRLVERNNMGKDKEETPKKLYAQPVYSDLVGFEELLGEISEAGIPSNQVKRGYGPYELPDQKTFGSRTTGTVR